MRTWKPGGLSNGSKRLISVAAVVGALYTHQRLWGLGISVSAVEVFSAPVAVGAVGLCLLNSTDYGPFSLKKNFCWRSWVFFL